VTEMSDQFEHDVEYVVKTIATTAVEHEKEFGDLDAVAGDGDLGYSLARGFEKVLADWDTFDRSTPSIFLKKVGAVVTSRVGGTSGPLWGTGFLRAAAALTDSQDGTAVVAALRAAVAGIMARGKASLGDKTLLDALSPATDVLEQQLNAGADSATAVTAFADELDRAARATSVLEARRGRASYTGERSIGSPDAGATAVAVIGRAISDGWATR
jgi:dihydroxyacetone kinase-like protein